MVDNAKQAFSRRLRRALEHGGLPGGRDLRRATASRFGVSQEAVRKWLAGEAMPATKRLDGIAKELNVSVEWLLTGRGVLEAPQTVTVAEPDPINLPPPMSDYTEEVVDLMASLPEVFQMQVLNAAREAVQAHIDESNKKLARKARGKREVETRPATEPGEV